MVSQSHTYSESPIYLVAKPTTSCWWEMASTYVTAVWALILVSHAGTTSKHSWWCLDFNLPLLWYGQGSVNSPFFQNCSNISIDGTRTPGLMSHKCQPPHLALTWSCSVVWLQRSYLQLPSLTPLPMSQLLVYQPHHQQPKLSLPMRFILKTYLNYVSSQPMQTLMRA